MLPPTFLTMRGLPTREFCSAFRIVRAHLTWRCRFRVLLTIRFVSEGAGSMRKVDIASVSRRLLSEVGNRALCMRSKPLPNSRAAVVRSAPAPVVSGKVNEGLLFSHNTFTTALDRAL